MRVLVTGGAGFIGSHVVDRLLADGHAVDVVDNLATGRRERVPRAVRLHVCDLRDARLDAVVAAAQPGTVVHVAAQAAVSRSVADPRFDASVNVLGTIALLEACRRAGVRRVVYTSTGGAAYGDTDVLPTPEDHPLRPASPYGVSKTSAERYLDCWAGLTGGRALTCIVNGDGEQTRDYVYVGDVAEAAARAVTSLDVSGVVNVATGAETTVNDLYRRLARITQVSQAPEHGPARPGEQRRSVLDATRAKAWLGWTATVSLDEGLMKTVTWFQKELRA